MRRGTAYLLLAAFAVLAVALHVGGFTNAVTTENLLSRREMLKDVASSHPLLAPLVFGLVYIAVAAFALPVAAILSMLGGFLFGTWGGAALVLISATVGATIVFLLARSALGRPLRRKAGPLHARIAANMNDNAFGYLMFMRLVPLFPFVLVNLVAALFDVRLRQFVVATLIGMAPATVVYANIGRQIGEISNPKDLVSPGVIAALTASGLLVLTPSIYRQWIAARSKPRPNGEG